MSAVLGSSHVAYRTMGQNRRLEAGIAAIKPDYAMSRVMDSTGVLLALPDDKLAPVLDDFKLTASRINNRIASMEKAQ